MNNIVSIATGGAKQKFVDLRLLRKEFGLSLTQAAIALEVSPATIENWEMQPEKGPNPHHMEEKYRVFISVNGNDAGKNLVFRQHSLRIVREILGLSVEQIASDYGYSKSSWLKLESNVRALSPEKISDLENRVREHFVELCN